MSYSLVNCIKMAFQKVRQYTTTEGKTYIEEIEMVERPNTLTIMVKQMEDSVKLEHVYSFMQTVVSDITTIKQIEKKHHICDFFEVTFWYCDNMLKLLRPHDFTISGKDVTVVDTSPMSLIKKTEVTRVNIFETPCELDDHYLLTVFRQYGTFYSETILQY